MTRLINPNSSAWISGYEARSQGKSAETNTYADPEDQSNFIDGWLTADAEAEHYGFPIVDPLSDIRITAEFNPESFEGEIETRLLASLRRNVPASDYASFGILARNRDGEIVGGLVGGTSYGWLLIKMLWVADDVRNLGLGTRIMRLAEETALRQGCHGAWLDTSSARARAFYEKLGYGVFGLLENREGEQPQGHARFFLYKRLSV